MAELHITGQVLGGSGFQFQTLFCKWSLVSGRNWELLEGLDQGQTQVDCAPDGEMVVWAHPIDVHYSCKGLTGWPKLHFQVWGQDIHGRNDVCGYGFCHVPTAPGMHELDCVTWIPEGTVGERLRAFFVGGNPRLKLEEIVHTPGDRFRLQTQTSGIVHLQLGVIMKDFVANHVKC
uniref:B9 domain-containing protein 2 n=1 Tax=Dunaliella tertiolecta TaxID=3047 RepID=A0A7S3R578_DUNTE|mmetsp:Transcript_1187/g.2844  ORF Transcript_1187/g.2844 Transcript_1187/m.2844 type:complete len:176 (-) Transcript_1187:374-901(-)